MEKTAPMVTAEGIAGDSWGQYGKGSLYIDCPDNSYSQIAATLRVAGNDMYNRYVASMNS
jgi:hypothetical protein